MTEILRTIVGSGLHGIAIEGTDDRDEMGIFVEVPENVLGLAGSHDHDVFRTQPEGVRSGPNDLDLVRYSLRKYLRLATKGNPTVLMPLFAPANMILIETSLGRELRGLAPEIVSQEAGHRFRGYLHQQREGLLGVRRGQREELIGKYGYDTKFAGHALRLAIQGVELMTEGRLDLPMKPKWREYIKAIKLGMITRSEVIKRIDHFDLTLRQILDGEVVSPLRRKPNLEAISEWSIQAHLRHWASEA